MSSNTNTAILEAINEEVNELSPMAVISELGITPMADSFDEFLAFADMEKLRYKLVFKRFEEMSA